MFKLHVADSSYHKILGEHGSMCHLVFITRLGMDKRAPLGLGTSIDDAVETLPTHIRPSKKVAKY